MGLIDHRAVGTKLTILRELSNGQLQACGWVYYPDMPPGAYNGEDALRRDLWSLMTNDAPSVFFVRVEHLADIPADLYLSGSIARALFARPIPATGREQVAEAIECLKRARDLLKASDNRNTLARVQAALSSAKGAARIQSSRAIRLTLRSDDTPAVEG